MPLEYSLTDAEQIGSTIIILAYIFIIISGQQTKQNLLENRTGSGTNPNMPRPSQLVAAASWVRVVGVFILALVASARLNQRKSNLETGKETGSLVPNINITAGSWSALISYIIEGVGSQQRAEEPAAMITLV